jgi:hypothetical protein
MDLRWMVSLYNNKLNGILADEMASSCVIRCLYAYSPSNSGSWKDDPDDLTRRLPHGGQEAAWALFRHRSSQYYVELVW